MSWSEVETSVIVDVLRGVASDWDESADSQLDGRQIGDAFESLGKRDDITWEEMAQLEFAFASVLEHQVVGMPNLERYVAGAPVFWIQLLALVFWAAR